MYYFDIWHLIAYTFYMVIFLINILFYQLFMRFWFVFQAVMPLVLKELASSSETNRRNAAFCVGELCKNGGASSLKYCSTLICFSIALTIYFLSVRFLTRVGDFHSFIFEHVNLVLYLMCVQWIMKKSSLKGNTLWVEWVKGTKMLGDSLIGSFEIRNY